MEDNAAYSDWTEGFLERLDAGENANKLRAEMVSALSTARDHLYPFLLRNLTEGQQLAIQLGELIDQGLCPADVHRHLDLESAPAHIRVQFQPTEIISPGFGAPYNPPEALLAGWSEPGRSATVTDLVATRPEDLAQSCVAVRRSALFRYR